MIIQEAKLTTANADLDAAQAQLDDKQRELDIVQALYDEAMSEKQVNAHIVLIRSSIYSIDKIWNIYKDYLHILLIIPISISLLNWYG